MTYIQNFSDAGAKLQSQLESAVEKNHRGLERKQQLRRPFQLFRSLQHAPGNYNYNDSCT